MHSLWTLHEQFVGLHEFEVSLQHFLLADSLGRLVLLLLLAFGRGLQSALLLLLLDGIGLEHN